MSGRFSKDAETFAEARTPRRQYRCFDTKFGIMRDAIAEPQAGTWRVTVFDDAKNSHQ
jgi:hypothetical protein